MLCTDMFMKNEGCECGSNLIMRVSKGFSNKTFPTRSTVNMFIINP